MFPIGRHTQPAELPALDIHKIFGKLMALRTEFRNGHPLAVEFILFDNGTLDRHSMVVPARNIGGAETGHIL